MCFVANPNEDSRRWRCAAVSEVVVLDMLLFCCAFVPLGNDKDEGEGENTDKLSDALVTDYTGEA